MQTIQSRQVSGKRVSRGMELHGGLVCQKYTGVRMERSNGFQWYSMQFEVLETSMY